MYNVCMGNDFATPALYFFSAVAQTMGAILAIVLTGVFAIIPQIQQRNNNPGSSVLIKALKRDDNFLNAVYFGFAVILLSIIGLLLIYVTGQNQSYSVFLLFILALPIVVLGVISCYNLWIFVSIKVTIYGHLINYSSHIIHNILRISKYKNELDSKRSSKLSLNIEATYIEALILTDALYPNYKNGSKRTFESIIFIKNKDVYLQALKDLHTDIVSMGPIINLDVEKHFYNNLFELLWLLPIQLCFNCSSELLIKNHAIMNAIFSKCSKEKMEEFISEQVTDVTWHFNSLIDNRPLDNCNVTYYSLLLSNITFYLQFSPDTSSMNLFDLISILDILIKQYQNDKFKTIFAEYGKLLFLSIIHLFKSNSNSTKNKTILDYLKMYKSYMESIYFEINNILSYINNNEVYVMSLLFLLDINTDIKLDHTYTIPRKDILKVIKKFDKKDNLENRISDFLKKFTYFKLHDKDTIITESNIDLPIKWEFKTFIEKVTITSKSK